METHVKAPVRVEHADGGFEGRRSQGIGLHHGELIDHRCVGPNRFLEATIEPEALGQSCDAQGPHQGAIPGDGLRKGRQNDQERTKPNSVRSQARVQYSFLAWTPTAYAIKDRWRVLKTSADEIGKNREVPRG